MHLTLAMLLILHSGMSISFILTCHVVRVVEGLIPGCVFDEHRIPAQVQPVWTLQNEL